MSTDTLAAGGLTCPAPATAGDRVQLGHGSGGKMSATLLRDRFLPHLGNPTLAQLGDAAVLAVGGAALALSTDTFVVHPLEFPGGNIGDLAVNGTLNDLAMMGARPQALSAGFVLEEGLPFDVLDRVVRAMGRAARTAGVIVATGDTKVVERGKADGLYVNTSGVGLVSAEFRPAPDQARPGDVVLVSGPLGRHGIAVLAARGGIDFEVDLESDSAYLGPLVERLREALGPDVHTLRDPTRGGLASTLNEIAAASDVGIALREGTIPIPEAVAGACEMLGFDPLYVANEGVLAAFVPAARAGAALTALRSHPLGQHAAVIGRVVADHRGMVVLETGIGGTRIVDLLPGDQLPRIC
ncbi:MAG TPA: hydrogenase expression/formation protein HypE [Gemmatimonadales bacterium]|nr:hydrogenase expression/formation protein HypE [Gemmatimonadales bacterium]